MSTPISSSFLHFLTHAVWTVIYLFRFISLSLSRSFAKREMEPALHQQADTHVRLSLSHFENYPDPPTSRWREREGGREGEAVREWQRGRQGWRGLIPVCMCALVYESVCSVRDRQTDRESARLLHLHLDF